MFQFQHARHISVCKLMGENWRPTKASLWLVCTTGHLTRTGCWWRALQLQKISSHWALILAGDFTKQTYAEKAAQHPGVSLQETTGVHWGQTQCLSRSSPQSNMPSVAWIDWYFQWCSNTKSVTYKDSPNHHYSKQTVFFPLFLFSAVVVDSTLACSAHAGSSSPIVSMLSTPATYLSKI